MAGSKGIRYPKTYVARNSSNYLINSNFIFTFSQEKGTRRFQNGAYALITVESECMSGRISASEFNRMVQSGELTQDAKGKWVKSSKGKPSQKYKNRRMEVDGISFDSVLEAQHYQFLKGQKLAGLIIDFECQVRFPITDEIKNDDGSLFAKKIDYIADFVVVHLDGSKEVIDTKGMILPLYELKRSIMYHRHGIKITEIFKGKKTRKQVKKSSKVGG